MQRSEFVIIIPCYNEEETIEAVISRAMLYADVCVIDDCSTDASPEILAAINNIHIIRHKTNTHIARGILDGMQYAMDQGYKYAITMDAGLSHNPDEIPLFMNHDGADLVLGKRVKKINTPLSRRVLSFVGSLVYNVCLDFPRLWPKPYYSDLTTGFRRFSRKSMEVLLLAPMKSRSFDFIFESTTLIYRAGLKITEVHITYNFSNSSLNSRVLGECIKIVLDIALRK
ncbi:MAG: glycosyltransferase family 2 protein [Rhodospirillales bacterium]|nr:glycosyltransferase family 2 protein [Rhodospirillales bacterium]